MWCEVSDLRQVEGGLWFPFAYVAETCTTEPAHYASVATVKAARVNTTMSDDMLDIRFPAGTVVVDEIANRRYVVDDVKDVDRQMGMPDFGSQYSRPSSSGVVEPQSVSATHPASDAVLNVIGDGVMANAQDSSASRLSIFGYLLWGGVVAGICVLLLWIVRHRFPRVRM